MPTQLQARCPKCGQRYSVADSMVGRTFQCSKCATAFVLAGPAGGTSAAPPEGGPGASSGGRATVGGGGSSAGSTSGGEPGAAAPPPGPSGEPQKVGPFEIRRRLGGGAFGVVYLAYHPFLRKEVAVKLLRPEALASAQSVERFEREAQVLAQMNHPNVPRVYDAGRHGDGYYLASEYIAGQDLTAVIPDGGLEPSRAVRLVVQMLRALGYAHGLGIVHRDVKPSNVRVDERDTLFLMDFGLAGVTAQEVLPAGEDPRRLTRTGAVVGTPAYMAPEQASGLAGLAGPAADLYSAGVVLYELLTGRLPFEGASLPALLYATIHTPPTPPSHYRPRLDARLDAICLRALAKRPEDRYPSAEDFAAALDAWLKGEPAKPIEVEPLAVLPAAAPSGKRGRPAPPGRKTREPAEDADGGRRRPPAASPRPGKSRERPSRSSRAPLEGPAPQAHRGGMLLTLGILGLLCVPIVLGPITLVIASMDLRAMAAGHMDRSGLATTHAARTLGIIGTVWGVFGMGLVFLLYLIGFLADG